MAFAIHQSEASLARVGKSAVYQMQGVVHRYQENIIKTLLRAAIATRTFLPCSDFSATSSVAPKLSWDRRRLAFVPSFEMYSTRK